MFQISVAPSIREDGNYMASVQSLSALADNYTVTSFPPSAGTPAQLQYPPPSADSFDLQAAQNHGQSLESGQAYGYRVPAYWQHGGRAHPGWNVNRFAGAIGANDHDWSAYQANAGLHSHAQPYVNGLDRRTESSNWRRGWSVRYHPYAAAASTAGCRTDSVGVSPSSTSCRYACNGVDQRAPVYAAQSYSHSPGGAIYDFSHQMAYDAAQPAYVAYPIQRADYVTGAYGPHQVSQANNEQL